MIIREVIQILDDTIGVLYSNVNSCIDYEYEETDIPIKKEQENDNHTNNP